MWLLTLPLLVPGCSLSDPSVPLRTPWLDSGGEPNRGGACWWAASVVVHYGSVGVVGVWRTGEIPVGLAGTGTTTPVGAIIRS